MLRRSRMRREGTGKRLALTARDLEIFRQLGRYRYLRSTYLHAFAGGASETRFKERLGDLFHEGYLDRPDEQWRFADALHAPVVHEAGKGSRSLLRDGNVAGVTWLGAGANRQFEHAMMICEVLASIELASRSVEGLRFIGWSEILARAPEATRALPVPFRLPCTAGSHLVPDGLFGIEYAAGGRKRYRFFALEADRGTMPILRGDTRQSSVMGKLTAYRESYGRDMHRTQLGIPNLLVMLVTTCAKRAEAIVENVQASGMDAPAVLVRAISNGDLRRPCSDLMFAPWMRPGLAPFNFADSGSMAG